MSTPFVRSNASSLRAEDILRSEDILWLRSAYKMIDSMIKEVSSDTNFNTKLFGQDPSVLKQNTIYGTESVSMHDCPCCKRRVPAKYMYPTYKDGRGEARDACQKCHNLFNGNGRRFLSAISKRLVELTENPMGAEFNQGKRLAKKKESVNEVSLSMFFGETE